MGFTPSSIHYLISNKGTKDQYGHYWFKNREWKENPAHLIDFSDFVRFIVERMDSPQTLDAHFRYDFISTYTYIIIKGWVKFEPGSPTN